MSETGMTQEEQSLYHDSLSYIWRYCKQCDEERMTEEDSTYCVICENDFDEEEK